MIRPFVVLTVTALLILSCSVAFTPAECDTFNQGIHDFLYRDFLRGENEGECYEIWGDILEPVNNAGYRISTEGYGTSYETDDVFLYWEGEERFVEGDFVSFVGMVVEPLSYETVLGAERTIPAFQGASIKRLR